MKKNLGTTDVAARLVIGLLLLALWGFKIISGAALVILLVTAGIFILTALLEYCPLYGVTGISTCTDEKN